MRKLCLHKEPPSATHGTRKGCRTQRCRSREGAIPGAAASRQSACSQEYPLDLVKRPHRACVTPPCECAVQGPGDVFVLSASSLMGIHTSGPDGDGEWGRSPSVHSEPAAQTHSGTAEVCPLLRGWACSLPLRFMTTISVLLSISGPCLMVPCHSL